MKLQSLLTSKFNDDPKTGFIISGYDNIYQAQQVSYHPEILNLGVILLGYYTSIKKIHQLFSLGNLISVGHYIQSPTILKYGTNFKTNPNFNNLPAKSRQHLIDELHDGTIAVYRDLHQSTPLIQGANLHNLIGKLPSRIYYYYFNNQWLVINNKNISPLSRIINNQLRKEIVDK